MIDKVLKFLDDGIPKNDFDRQLLASNLVGTTNLIELNKREREITLKKQLKLQLNPIKGNFDYQHLKDIHKALFEDVYTWAGKDRMEVGLHGNFGKYAPNGTIINFVPGKDLNATAQQIFTYKYKLYKTKKTKHIDELINIACSVYNHCIALHKRYYKLYHKSLNKARLQKHLTKLKKLDKYKHWNKLGSQAIQQITERIDNAYKKFFKKLGGLPSFKKRIKYKSFTLKGSVGYKLKDNVISFNGYSFKFSKNQVIKANDKIKTITIKRDNLGSFYICVSLETNAKNRITTGKSVGIDFGLKTFLTLSDNTTINSPLIYLKSLKELKAKQRKFSSKKIGSNNRKKAKLELAKFHIKLANQRKDYFFKLANILAKKYDNVFIEDLNLKAMAKIWGRKINDLAFNEFINILATKTNVVKIDKFYPSSKTCSCCGYIKNDLNLKDRVYICDKCGLKLDRDYNASLNIYRVGASTLSGEFVRPTKVG